MPEARHRGGEVRATLLLADVLQSPAMPSSKHAGEDQSRYLLRKHRLHAGVYARVARKLGVHESYVSRVARGERSSDRILAAIVSELRRIERL